MNFSRKSWYVIVFGAVLLALAACGSEPTVDTVKEATDKYQDVNVALADGYVATDNCVSSPAGAMGFHYVNTDLARDPDLDPSKPEILLYIPTDDGVKLNSAPPINSPSKTWGVLCLARISPA